MQPLCNDNWLEIAKFLGFGHLAVLCITSKNLNDLLKEKCKKMLEFIKPEFLIYKSHLSRYVCVFENELKFAKLCFNHRLCYSRNVLSVNYSNNFQILTENIEFYEQRLRERDCTCFMCAYSETKPDYWSNPETLHSRIFG